MATISVEIRVTSRLPQMRAQIAERVSSAFAKAALDIEAQAKVRAPVDTGLLKNSIAARKEGDTTWVVESPVNYSVFQEFGTRFMPAQPFMLPAAEYVRPSLEAALKQLVP